MISKLVFLLIPFLITVLSISSPWFPWIFSCSHSVLVVTDLISPNVRIFRYRLPFCRTIRQVRVPDGCGTLPPQRFWISMNIGKFIYLFGNKNVSQKMTTFIYSTRKRIEFCHFPYRRSNEFVSRKLNSIFRFFSVRCFHIGFEAFAVICS